MFVPEYDKKRNIKDEASYDVFYKKYTDAYNRAVKNAKKYVPEGKEYLPGSELLTRKEFIEEIRKRAKDPQIAAKYKAAKKGMEFLAKEMGKKDARQFEKGQAIAILKKNGMKEEDIDLHTLTKMMYTTEDIWDRIKREYKNLRKSGKNAYDAKIIISSEFFGSD